MSSPVSIAGILQSSTNYLNFKSAWGTAESALNNVESTGTILYNDPFLADKCPQSFPAFQTFLIAVQSAITTFEQSLPSEPPISG